ncbi:hypothetical protein FRUB_06065 [Fimbriiglobus ruber]|uniref:Lipoprotein n=1 Tax=Fimbriiglobus ruber TaxID=1908690 RepID=A0A225D1R7_9BACT|nr:hypothetical protein FRUB_08025 [Fimbriiglobus ruber]OWK39502.1 hypothetical protein FRUB_06065 [Fimbriiglobus ruber]
MKRLVFCLILSLLLSGCVSPRAIYCGLIVRQEGAKECE